MWWRVRTTLPDRPGALAALAQECGKAGVNIVALQVFPGTGSVTDELVLTTPSSWGADDLVDLLERAGGGQAIALPCDESAQLDQPSRYVEAARSILGQPASFPDVLARLLDADVHPREEEQDVLEVTVDDVVVQVRRRAPFTAVEHRRAEAMADLVGDVLGRERPAFVGSGTRRMGGGASPEYVVQGEQVLALADGVRVAAARVRPAADDEPGLRAVDLEVEVAWQRRGVGTKLLGEAARLARALGAEEILLTAASDNRAVLPMVLSAGMRGRIRMAGDRLTVRISVADPRPH